MANEKDVVKFSEGFTINLGNYQTYKFELGREMHYDPEETTYEEAYEKVRKTVLNSVYERINSIEMNPKQKEELLRRTLDIEEIKHLMAEIEKI